MGKKITDGNEFASVLNHPIRCRVLNILCDREASPVQMSLELGINASHVAYHVRLLHKADLIDLMNTNPSRGSIEHHYRAALESDLEPEDVGSLSPAARELRSRRLFSFAVADASCALSAGGFSAASGDHISRAAFVVDEAARTELAVLYEEMRSRLERIRAEAGERLRSRGEYGVSVMTFNTVFDRTVLPSPAGGIDGSPKGP